MRLLLFLALISTLSSTQAQTKQEAKKTGVVRTAPCATEADTIRHKYQYGDRSWERTVTLPATGKFVEESHYITTEDSLGTNRWPAAPDEGIENHLKRSFALFLQYDSGATYEQLYQQNWQKQWTPEEGGHFGQGAVGNSQLTELTPEMEMWFMTMMWDKGERPKRGTRFLLSANGKQVIVVAGFETGPASKDYLGGVTREVHSWLGTTAQSAIKVSLLTNQNLPPGPVNCQ